MPVIRFEETSIKSPGSDLMVCGILSTIIIDSKSTWKNEMPAMREDEKPRDVLARAHPEIKNNYGPELLEYLEGRSSIIGTPIESVSAINKAQCENLKLSGIYTVEDLASDAATPRIEHMGAVGPYLQGIARKYLADMSGAPDTRDAEIEALKSKIEQMQAAMEGKKSAKG